MNQSADDRLLIERIASHDESALRSLLTIHQVRVFRFLMRRLGNDALAEELTNEVFAEVWLNAQKFESRSQVSTWLLAIAHNRMVSSLRKRREASWDEDKASELVDDADTPEVTAQKADKGQIIRRCLDRLSPTHREIIDLVYYHDQSIAEVSSILGIPEATVKTRMFYARKQLADVLKAAGIDRGWP